MSEKPRRSTSDLLILVLTGVVAFFIIASTLFVIIAELHDPLIDTSVVAKGLNTMITAILGALLGLIAGRSDK